MAKEKIIIVEDESLVAKDIKHTLHRSGYEVQAVASSGEEALKKLQHESPDLVLMDIKLDGTLDGIETSRRITKRHNVPIVYLTAHMNDRILQEVTETKPFAYLKKPYSSERLHSTIEVALEKHRSMERERKAYQEQIIRTKERKDEEIEYLAFHDPLTDLPNRFHIQNTLEQYLEEQEGKEEQAKNSGALLFVDLVGFQHINDAFGHSFGDRVLKQLAKRFEAELDESVTVARWSGDVFTVFIPDLEGMDEVEDIVERLCRLLSYPYETQSEDHQFKLECSIGGSLYPEHGTTADELTSKADIALFEAKKKDGNSFEFYEEGTKVQVEERVKTMNLLRTSIDDQSFEVHFQPLIDVDDGSVASVEALARWQHPDGTIKSGGEFIPVAESSGMIVQLGDIILNKTCERAVEWKEEHDWTPNISINVSTKQLLDKQFVHSIRHHLSDKDLQPEQLELEITETTLMKHTERSVQILNSLRKLGVQIAIDDFGTGFSSMKYLIQLPVDTLKIDHYFTSRVNRQENILPLIEVMNVMSERLDLKTVIEGVETEEEKEALTPHCDVMQGFYFAHPMPSSELCERYVNGV